MKFPITVLALTLLSFRPALAMQVVCDSPEVNFTKADVVFVGTVKKREVLEEENPSGLCWTQEQGKKCGAKVVSIEMEEALKGEFQETVSVKAGDGCYCVDPYLDEGIKYIIFGMKTENSGEFDSMNACATAIYDKRYYDLLTKRKNER